MPDPLASKGVRVPRRSKAASPSHSARAQWGRPSQRSRQERDHLHRLLPRVQVEERPGCDHFVHLADADRFAAGLHAFVDFCDTARS